VELFSPVKGQVIRNMFIIITCLLIVGYGSAFIIWKMPINKKLRKIDKSSDKEHYGGLKKGPERIYNNLKNKVLKDALKYFKPSGKKEELFFNDLKNELYREIHNQISYWVLYESARLSHRLEELSDRVQTLEKSSSPEINNIKKEADEISRELTIFRKHFYDKGHLLNG
jgi:hypothetical protein